MSSVLTTESVRYGTDNVYPIFGGYFVNFAFYHLLFAQVFFVIFTNYLYSMNQTMMNFVFHTVGK